MLQGPNLNHSGMSSFEPAGLNSREERSELPAACGREGVIPVRSLYCLLDDGRVSVFGDGFWPFRSVRFVGDRQALCHHIRAARPIAESGALRPAGIFLVRIEMATRDLRQVDGLRVAG